MAKQSTVTCVGIHGNFPAMENLCRYGGRLDHRQQMHMPEAVLTIERADRSDLGAHLTTEKAIENPLPEDYGPGMQVLCNVLHHRGDHVPDRLEPVQILKLATLSDKYDCAISMKYAARTWVQPHLAATDMPTLSKLLVATYHFEDEYSFKIISESIIWRSIGTVTFDKAELPESAEDLVTLLGNLVLLFVLRSYLYILQNI